MSDDRTSGTEVSSGTVTTETTVANGGIVQPGSTPTWPAHAGGAHLHNLEELAEAAWKQAGGSITAFEQLCVDHVRGDLNLLNPRESAEERAERLQRDKAPVQQGDPGSTVTSAYTGAHADQTSGGAGGTSGGEGGGAGDQA